MWETLEPQGNLADSVPKVKLASLEKTSFD